MIMIDGSAHSLLASQAGAGRPKALRTTLTGPISGCRI
jgi:hypothetical protein